MCDAECISLSGLKLKWYSSDEQDGRYDRIRKPHLRGSGWGGGGGGLVFTIH